MINKNLIMVFSATAAFTLFHLSCLRFWLFNETCMKTDNRFCKYKAYIYIKGGDTKLFWPINAELKFKCICRIFIYLCFFWR